MGINDRDYQREYYQERQPGIFLGGARSLTTNIVIVMVAIYLVQWITRKAPEPNVRDAAGWFTNFFELHADVVKRPWMCFELLTYGFLHDPWDVRHILFNMVTFWFFGRAIEYRYGQREYLAFFLVSIVVAGVIWVVGERISNGQFLPIPMLGASGGISAVLLLFCLNFPKELIYIWGVLPIPAWIFAIMFVAMDLFGTTGNPNSDEVHVAFTAHLGGALFAFIYFQSGMRLQRMVPGASMFKALKPKPKFRVFDADSDPQDETTDEVVDAILKKIQEHGRGSLTRQENQILEQASREYQKRRK